MGFQYPVKNPCGKEKTGNRKTHDDFFDRDTTTECFIKRNLPI